MKQITRERISHSPNRSAQRGALWMRLQKLRGALIILLLCLGTTAHSQVIKDQQGNYIVAQAQSTGKTFTDAKGNIYPVMMSINGKLFIVRTSKTGKVYKQYLKVKE
jgi:type VI protein secretion system component VasK